ncbi:MAG TPA: beta-ketoacyl-ACP synthase III [Anaerolineales bacterium]|nr:beta-ketoacyl-ACP synthase III [Anaerolineales bacterium]
MMKRYGNIIGWGKYVPARVITNADLEKTLDTSDEWIVTRTGIRERHIADHGENTSQMSIAAARDALEMAGVRPKDLDLIIVATSSPDYLTPPISSQVQHGLGAKHVGAFTLVTGCTGFVYALSTAQQFISSGTSKTILVVGAELLSRFVDWNDRETCVLFGDGAGAVVVQATEVPSGVLSFVLGSDGSGGEHLILPAGGSANPPSHKSLDAGLHSVKMNGREVFKFATRVLGKALRQAIQQAGLHTQDIDLFIPHQANIRIIESAARFANLPPEKVFVNIHKYGNTSAASIPIALCEAFEEGRAKIGDTLAFVAFGAGLTWAAAIVKVTENVKSTPKPRWQNLFTGWVSRERRVKKDGRLISGQESLSEPEVENT